MIRLNKKQINAIIKLLKSMPCQTRPALQTMRIKRDGFIYITNGYIAIRFMMEVKPIPKDDSQKEFIITVANLENWYKSAKSYDYLDETSILSLHDNENNTVYPDIPKLFIERLNTKPNLSDDPIHIDTDLLKLFSNISSSSYVTINHYPNCVYVRALKYPDIDGLIMELNS